MIWIFLAALISSGLTTLAIVFSADLHAPWSADHDLSGPQKMHVKVVPRIGGLGIFVGFLAGLVASYYFVPEVFRAFGLMFLCLLPAFLSGIWEDLTKAISPRRRMAALALSGLLGVFLIGGSIIRTGWVQFDHLLTVAGLVWLGSAGAVFGVTGIANSVNIIDGMNGLASMCIMQMACGLGYIAWCVGDPLIGSIALSTLAGTLGFFVFNYPRGLVFLGDGGAYMLGFVVAETGIVLTVRHHEVSMLAPLLLVAYPFFETLFSMYRRRVVRGRPMMEPDGIHLHTLIYRRLKRGAPGASGHRDNIRANSRTSPYLWFINLLAVVPAAIWWNNTPALAVAMMVFICTYISIYRRIVRFHSPQWMGGGVAQRRS